MAVNIGRGRRAAKKCEHTHYQRRNLTGTIESHENCCENRHDKVRFAKSVKKISRIAFG